MVSNIYYAFVVLGTIIFCVGAVILLKTPFYKLAVLSVKQLDIILDQSISEKEKDQSIIHNLFELLKFFVLTITLLIFLLICGVLPAFIYLHYQPNLTADTSSVYFYLSICLGSFSLFLFKNKSDYAYWSRLLHTIILDNYNLGKFLFKREVKKYGKNLVLSEKPFVIVTGLARAGTTALTNLIFDEKKFHSISYANVPFLLAPNFWRKIYNPRISKKRERAHGDKVLFSENSIEALEEYFFKVFLNDSYIKKDRLLKHEVSEDLLVKYYAYQELFRQRKGTIYLAKNNNFILRLESILHANKLIKTILIFRNPIDHAKSLLYQHENFLLMQREFNFVLNYMDWLGHYEFGINQKYFELEHKEIFKKYDKSSLDYWLAIWLNYYSYIINILNSHKICLVHYDDLLKRPNKLKEALEIYLGIELAKDSQGKFKPKKREIESLYEVDHDLLEKTKDVYQELLMHKIELK